MDNIRNSAMLNQINKYLSATFLLLFLATAQVVAQSSKGIYHVTANAAADGDGSSWQSPMTLANALAKASAGEEVWVKGYSKLTDDSVYHAPTDGFLLRSGVKLYGGLRGDEQSSAEAASPSSSRNRYDMQYQSVLLADSRMNNDSVPANYIIFPENPTRADNARHCLVMNLGVSDEHKNDACLSTVVCGMVFAGGNASGKEDSDDGHGGGLLIINRSSRSDDGNASKRSYDVSQCYFVNNYAARGGAIYVDPSVTNSDNYANRIRHCAIYNNAAGSRATNVNCGAGVWLGGSAVLCNSELFNNTGGGVCLSDKAKVVNTTIVHNTITAVDLTDATLAAKVPTANGGGTLYNTVLWGSSTLSKTETKPAFRNCAYPEVQTETGDKDDNQNQRISYNNFTNEEAAAWFTAPTSNIGYDRSFDMLTNRTPEYSFVLMDESSLIGAGDTKWYTEYVSSTLESEVDLGNSSRYNSDDAIDIGAYEFETLAKGRRLYVSKTGDNSDGLSWATAYADPQRAIDQLYGDGTRGKGEVWIAKGVYVPQSYIKSNIADDQTTPLAFQMRNGISVYGGFDGTEDDLSDRKYKGNEPWQFANETILRGSDYTENSAKWNTTDEMWAVSSKSYHVVWFAANPYEMKTIADAEFSLTTVLDGVIVEGGSASSNGDLKFCPQQGAGIYMMGANNSVRRCIVRNNNAGMKSLHQSATLSPQGGGIYNLGGQIRYSLVYNNSAAEGGGIYMSAVGFVNNSMVANNSAVNGSGIFVDRSFAQEQYLIIATNVITNNTSTSNGAVYVKGDGLVEQCTIGNNYTSNVTDDTGAGVTSHTGGLYITGAATVINNILWNNSLKQTAGKDSKKATESLAQVYAYRPSRDSTLFYNNAITDVNSTAWNDVYQTGTYELTSSEFAIGSGKQYNVADSLSTQRGVQATWTNIDYYWITRPNSVLRDKGMLYGQFAKEVLFKPCTDFHERNFEAKPPIGPYISDSPEIVFDAHSKPGTLRLYFDDSTGNPQGNGSSWAEAYTSLNDLLTYIGTLSWSDDTPAFVDVVGDDGEIDDHLLDDADRVEILVREGEIVPTHPYTFQENDPKASSFVVKASQLPVTILGGYPSKATNERPTDADRAPAKYRTEFTGSTNALALSEGRYHVFRVETGANITLDGIAITRGYAAGSAYMPYGGAMLAGSLYAIDKPTKIMLRNCIIENNSAHYGSAIAAMNDLRNAELSLVNCVVNNNQSDNSDIIYTFDASNTYTFDHVSFINNIGLAPKHIGTSSFAAGNQTFDVAHNFSTANANNTISIATLGKEGTANFANPTNKVGAALSGNVYYGGNACYRPLTSSADNSVIINRAPANADVATDIAGNERNLGGLPDLGAYEALLPKAGKVIYVRSYNTDWSRDNWTLSGDNDGNDDGGDGKPDFSLLAENPNNVYDGLTWDRAVMGNAVCDTARVASADGTYTLGNSMYVQENGKLIAATLDNSKYGADYNAKSAPYGQTSNSYGAFFTTKGSSYDNGNYKNQKRADGTLYNLVTNNRDERYISGLQMAVETAARYNAAHKNDDGFEEMSVWVGAGIYTDFKGFVIRNGVKVYGGFPKDGNPGDGDRRPLLSEYVPARKGQESLRKADYETVLQVRKETPIYMTNSSRELWFSESDESGKKADGSYYDYTNKLLKSGKTERHYVLYQPDVCTTTWNIEGSEQSASFTSQDQYRYPGYGDGKWADTKYYQEYSGVRWDGFSIRHGYIMNYSACRDGGGGVRAFRGTTLENLIIVNNVTHGRRSRGGGLYMDGDKSIITNSFILRNMAWGNSDNYGGGAYMIQGTGYNLVVASNRSKSQGGGIFIESAKFYNNTVCYNMTNQSTGAGIMHWQNAKADLTGITSSLTLYNCLVYDNMKNGGGMTATQVGTSAASMFNRAYNCYVNGKMSSLASKFAKADGNITLDNYSTVAYPFSVKGNDTRYSSSQGAYVDGGTRFNKARAANNFRLNEDDGLIGNPCLNGGTEDMPSIPATDMDYTDRIKDCTIDIGAYEADNSTNITPQEKTRKKTVTTTTATGSTTTTEVDEKYYVYYVTETGYGNRSGSDPENAACAEKLQSVLTAAGHLADSLDYKYNVYVKVAGYETDEDGDRFVYHVNTLADANVPQSYTYLVPQGVWMMGGYNEGTWQTVTSGSGNSQTTTRQLTGYDWDNDQRDVISSRQTILSATTQPRSGSAVGEVTGLHVVTFGKWPTGEIADYDLHALPGKTVDGKLVNPSTGIDGVRLVGGEATDNSGFNGMGGGCVVPAYAHVRNCAIIDCRAISGGALALLPGAIVSGSVMHDNTARLGGAIYAANGAVTDGTVSYRAYMASCTVCENTATTGGGIYQELGALFGGNSVVWGNTATTDKNISGVVDQKFSDLIHHFADPSDTVDTYYPYNSCFVERYQLPGDIGNTSMTSDFDTYFATAGEFYPRPYSPLINNGVTKAYQRLWEHLGVADHDVKGVHRGSKDRLTVGAYAMVLPDVDDNVLLTRLFVSADGGAEVADDVKAKYIGRSFYTPFNSLDAAISYINHARTNNIGTATSPRYLANDNTRFEILVTGGTYRPSVVRELGSDVTGTIVADRRMQSFEIPANVFIYGSFDNSDPYSTDPILSMGMKSGDDANNSSDSYSLTEIVDLNGKTIQLTPDQNIEQLLADRNSKHRADLNKNGLYEPWEFANPTIFSGDIKASDTERKVYHVVFSRLEAGDNAVKNKNNRVVLDGITIVNGETADAVTTDDGTADGEEVIDDMGHGGGIFAYNMNYTLNRCRVLRNQAVHGAGIFVHDAGLKIIESAISGNLATLSLDDEKDGNTAVARGGAVCADFSGSGKGYVYALNSLFANNSAESNSRLGGSEGGAIFVNPGDITDYGYRYLNIMNCNIVRNRAMRGAELFVYENLFDESLPVLMTNTVCWGNESLYYMSNGTYKSNAHMDIFDNQMSHCATDLRPQQAVDIQTRSADMGNIIIDTGNMTAAGPRFKLPTTVAGYENYSTNAQWNPASLSVLTDAGVGSLKACAPKEYDDVYDEAFDEKNSTNVYVQWWKTNSDSYLSNDYYKEYIVTDKSDYRRFMGPYDANTGELGERIIDIGMYEFQYKFDFPNMEAVYIGTEDHGSGDGSNWDNQSSDLRGAIIAMANPTGNTTSELRTDRHVYVRSGEYFSPLLTGGDAFSLVVNSGKNRGLVKEVEIVGSCEGSMSKNDDGTEKQNFAEPTLIVPNPLLDGTDRVTNLLNITTNGRPVTISGFAFSNTHEYTGADDDKGGRGVTANINNDGSDQKASLTLKNCAFRDNLGTGLNITANDGRLLVYNALFADGKANGMDTRGTTTVVNATFAQNSGYDYTAADSKTKVYNSVSWQNGTSSALHTLQNDAASCNTAFAWDTPNDDVLNGPNFSSPSTGDYSLRPSLSLFNTGDTALYVKHVFGIDDEPLPVKNYMSKERDIVNQTRVTGGNIDRGAYECSSKLLPIIYVKTGTTTIGSGESWTSPIGNLQNAVNLAELYANVDNAHVSKSAYVFVDKAVAASDVAVSLPGVKVYGTMDNETSTAGGDTKPEDYSKEQVANIVADLLAKRKGTIEQTTQSRINGLTIDYTPGDGTTDRSADPCVVDGFVVDGDVALNRGYLSTSVLAATSRLTGSVVNGRAEGVLYNSLALGKVEGVRSVNVTAVKDDAVEGSGSLPDVVDSKGNTCAANRAEATLPNRYVQDDYWKWQLNEFYVNADGTHDYSKLNADINANADRSATEACATAVGHRRDLAGNARFRSFQYDGGGSMTGDDIKYNNVDNGCFETWYVAFTTTATADDYPHGKSVVYVREEQRVAEGETQTMHPFHELRLEPGLYTESNPFQPGFLLLKFHAGLRGNGNYIQLNNLAAERELHARDVTAADGTVTKQGYADLCVMPFTTSKREQFENGVLEPDGTNELYSVYSYNGLARAAYDYKYDSADGKAWQADVLSTEYTTQGLMIVPKADLTLRFYATWYNETPNKKAVRLTPYNFQEPWSDSSTGGVRFTHKENMGWNLFGSPYLCAMNYSDWQYGRMIYADNILTDGGFSALNTIGDGDETIEGYIPACDAVFTQTATLAGYEQFSVEHSADFVGSAYQGVRTLQIQLSSAQPMLAPDRLQLNAVDASAAHAGFDMATDGVKWMATDAPQLYAESGEGRYSLLSAVNRDGEVKVGVSVPAAGTYMIALPDDCDTDGYEAVMLKDSERGTAVDLLDGAYQFTAQKAGEMNKRFTISFHKTAGGVSRVSVSRTSPTRVSVSGLQDGDEVRVYAPDGRIVNMQRASSDKLSMSVTTRGVLIVEVTRDGKQVGVRKV